MAHGFEFGGQQFEVAGEAALYWRAQNALLVSDLHLEKASAFALYGQMMPNTLLGGCQAGFASD